MGAQAVDPRKGRDKGGCSGWSTRFIEDGGWQVLARGVPHPSWPKDVVFDIVHVASWGVRDVQGYSTDVVESPSASPCFLTQEACLPWGLFLLSHPLQASAWEPKQPRVVAIW